MLYTRRCEKSAHILSESVIGASCWQPSNAQTHLGTNEREVITAKGSGGRSACSGPVVAKLTVYGRGEAPSNARKAKIYCPESRAPRPLNCLRGARALSAESEELRARVAAVHTHTARARGCAFRRRA